jgi:hypothetical protein
MTTTILESYFWEIILKKIDELCSQYNLIKIEGCYEICNISNDKYEINIYNHGHPQFDENLIETTIINKKTNEVKYTNTYLYLAYWDVKNVTLPKPTVEFIDEIFNNLQENLVI